jgi:hypothetical protein
MEIAFFQKQKWVLVKPQAKNWIRIFASKAGTGLGITPLGSGQDPTGVAKWAEKLLVPGGSTLRKLSPPEFERPLVLMIQIIHTPMLEKMRQTFGGKGN